jgi:hypothetical protein
VEPITAVSNTNLMAINFEYVDIQEATLWKPMSELENNIPNFYTITCFQGKKFNSNKSKEAMK